MKKLLFIATTFLSLSSYSMECMVSQASIDENSYDQLLAMYPFVEKSEKPITTIIKPSGEVLENFNLKDIFKDVETNEEMANIVADLAGSTIAMIVVDEDGKITLFTGVAVNSLEKMVEINAISKGTMDEYLSLFDIKEKISIVCVNTDPALFLH